MASFMFIALTEFLHCGNVHVKVPLNLLIGGVVYLGGQHGGANDHMHWHLNHTQAT